MTKAAKTVKLQQDATLAFSRNIVETTYDDIPKNVIEVIKKCILDTVGVTVAASSLGEGCRDIVDLCVEGGGKKESTVLGFGNRLPSWMAAFANGSMSHALDYDDVLDEGLTHLSVTTVIPGLAMAERVGKVSGKRFITAVTLGNELIARLCLAVARRPEGWEPTWMGTPILGSFSAAATCAKLMRLDFDQTVNALGIALNMAAGSHEIAFSTSSTLRGLYGAFPAKAGVLSALMAQRGVKTSQNTFEGEAGLFNLYYNGSYDKDSLISQLGKRFDSRRVSLKPWASCRDTHPFIEAGLRLAKAHDLTAAKVKRIIVVVGPFGYKLCQPLEGRQRPDSVASAKFSIPFNVATAMAKGGVTLGDFTLEGIRNPAILALSKKVEPVFDPKVTVAEGVPPAFMEVETNDGQKYSEGVKIAYGHPDKPMSMEAVEAKFRDCLSYSARPISARRIDRLISMLLNLQEVDDVGEVVRLLVPKA